MAGGPFGGPQPGMGAPLLPPPWEVSSAARAGVWRRRGAGWRLSAGARPPAFLVFLLCPPPLVLEFLPSLLYLALQYMCMRVFICSYLYFTTCVRIYIYVRIYILVYIHAYASIFSMCGVSGAVVPVHIAFRGGSLLSP